MLYFYQEKMLKSVIISGAKKKLISIEPFKIAIKKRDLTLKGLAVIFELINGGLTLS